MGQEPCPIPTNKGGRMPPRSLKLLTILVRIKRIHIKRIGIERIGIEYVNQPFGATALGLHVAMHPEHLVRHHPVGPVQ